jgi:hypothetical protein
MNMDQAATFLAGSILTSIGFVIVIGAVIVINNLLSKYWKPVQIIKWYEDPQVRFATQEELDKIEPALKK